MEINDIQQRVRHASSPIQITSKSQSDIPSNNTQLLTLSDYAGIIEYYPEELVVTVKAGTLISDIEHRLKQHQQALPFSIENKKIMTIGAAYAVGSPALRDAVLGIKIVDGQGRILNFGGQVMKNVAGYDVARLLVGSRGKLAVICEISFRALPRTYINNEKQRSSLIQKKHASLITGFEHGLKTIFDPNAVFI